MNYQRFVGEVLRVIALLLGLTIVDIAMIGFGPLIVPDEWLLQYMSFFPWISRLVFGIIMFLLVGHDHRTRISISLLSVMAPYYGALFYLLISTIMKKDK